MADPVEWLARRRVALGGVTALAAIVLAHPTWTSWIAGFVVACLGEGVRVWAAGHLEKSREVTTSGPYRRMRHPLYVGSSILALGVVIAARSTVLGVLATVYIVATIPAAIRSEEAFLRRTFGESYDRYARAGSPAGGRPFSLDRAMRNKEYRAVGGVLAGFGLLALKIRLHL
jgi:protein-S-isoprenylcysteine O-methyltransferase Ste14